MNVNIISCRVSHPTSHVILRSLSTGEEIIAYYDNKEGFLTSVSPGDYQCETTVNGQLFKSAIYTIINQGKARQEEMYFVMVLCHLYRNG